MSKETALVWLQQDLRIADNPALHHAIENDRRVIPVYVWSPEDEGDWAMGAASKWWLHYSLVHLGKRLETIGLTLVIRRGKPMDALQDLVKTASATEVYWNARYEPHASTRENKLIKALEAADVQAHRYHGNLLFKPGEIKTNSGTPYKVFTPFWKSCLEKLETIPPLPVPDKVDQTGLEIESLTVEDLNLLPEINWAEGFSTVWTPGESGAHESLGQFLDDAIETYPKMRDTPSVPGTSRLSPHLHFGELSPRQVHFEVRNLINDSGRKVSESARGYLRQIGWREFSYHLLCAFPETTTEPLYDKFKKFPWVDNDDALKKWQQGKTGFPLVDAGMRELWTTGWMHNRVRMIVASFLVKDLHIHWLEGAKWFWDTLVDADLANNTMGWQWCAGTGADASPFFRIFNPITQGQKFDANGDYIRKWIPELANLDDKRILEPWKLTDDELKNASSTDTLYPRRIVDHGEARKTALEAYNNL